MTLTRFSSPMDVALYWRVFARDLRRLTEPIYDLAFSFLTPDYQVAADLHRLLSPTHAGFLYTEQQKTLAGLDGYGKFAAVFSEQARLVVLVYREGLGRARFHRHRMYRHQASNTSRGRGLSLRHRCGYGAASKGAGLVAS